eukprot:gene9277-16971_t
MDILKTALEQFRRDKVLCDVKILSQDREHHAHRVILAAGSDYFRTMFESDFKETQSGVIDLGDISSILMDIILDFIYTGDARVSPSNACDLYCLADRLAMKGLKSQCRMYLLENQDTSTCLSILRMARCYNDECLEKSALDFILQNFTDLTKTQEFLDISKDELCEAIAHSEMNAEKEEDIYNAVICWADNDPDKRNKELADIFTFIRFPLMDLDFLENKVLHNNRVTDSQWNTTISDIYQRCCRFHKHNETHAFFWVPKDMPCYCRESRVPSYIIYIPGGWSNGRCLAITECYNPKSDRWTMAHNLKDPDGAKCYYGSAQLGKLAYFAGGYDGSAYLNTVRCFKPCTKDWSEIAPMHTKRCFNNLVALNNELYAIGGFDGMKRLSCVERYSVSLNQWTRVASLGTARSDSAAVTCDNHIYVFGGYSGDSLQSVEYYDGEVWRYATPMNSKRSGASVVSLPDGRIFMMGGYDGISRKNTTEFYHIKSDTWTDGPPMHTARSNFATCIAGSYVYAIGGYTGQTTLQDVERYDLVSESWTVVARLNYARSAMKACIFNGMHNLNDFIPFDTSSNGSKVNDCLIERLNQSEVTVERLLRSTRASRGPLS